MLRTDPPNTALQCARMSGRNADLGIWQAEGRLIRRGCSERNGQGLETSLVVQPRRDEYHGFDAQWSLSTGRPARPGGATSRPTCTQVVVRA